MEKIKINIDKPDLSDADILKHKNFGNVMKAVGKIQAPWYKTGKFWGLAGGGITVASVATVLIVNANSPLVETIADQIPPETNMQFVEAPADLMLTAAPFPSEDVSFEEFTIDPTIDNDIITADSSILVIPANSILNNDGTTATKKMTVRFRDFYTPYEIFLAGIPMDIKDQGEDSFLESAGMFEILAANDHQIDPEKPIQVLFKSTSSDGSYDQYSLNDEGWNNDNPCVTTEVSENNTSNDIALEVSKLTKPEMMQPGDHVRVVGADDLALFEEFNGYKYPSFKFEKKDAQLADKYLIPDSTKIERGDAAGTYALTIYTNGNERKAITTIVFDAKAHQEAMKVFNADQERIAEKNKRNQQDVVQDHSNMSFSSLSEPSKLILSTSNGNFQTFTLTRFGTFNCDKILQKRPKKYSIEFASKEERSKVKEVYSFFPGWTSVETKKPEEEIFIMQDPKSVIAFICEDNKIVIGTFKELKLNKNTIKFPQGKEMEKLEALALLASKI